MLDSDLAELYGTETHWLLASYYQKINLNFCTSL